MIKAGELDASGLADEKEAYLHYVVSVPLPTVTQVLVVIGSDRRSAVSGIYRPSEQMGVSPWYWFAHGPVFRRLNVSVAAMLTIEKPRVRDRGFFMNDEAPCFSGWTQKKFGGANSAMWAPRAFAADDPQSQVLAAAEPDAPA